MKSLLTRGCQVRFKLMFSGEIGQVILKREDLLALNLYACAGMESSHYHAASGDHGMSYGLFQIHTKVHKDEDIQKYIEKGLSYLGLDWNEVPRGYIDWSFAVGYKIPEYQTPTFASDMFIGMCVDPQLVCWIGYMVTERYIDNLCRIPVFMDIKKYQKAQRFHKDGMVNYAIGTKEHFWKGVSQYKWRSNNE